MAPSQGWHSNQEMIQMSFWPSVCIASEGGSFCLVESNKKLVFIPHTKYLRFSKEILPMQMGGKKEGNQK